MNARIRHSGLLAREVWTQRYQVTGDQLPIQDRHLIIQQHMSCTYNHAASAKSKAHGKSEPAANNINIGDQVFVKGDKDKTRARSKYIVVGVQ